MRRSGVLAAVWDFLSLSPFDRMRCLAVSVEQGAVSFVYASRVLNRISVAASNVVSMSGDGRYPTPTEVASALRRFKKEHGLGGGGGRGVGGGLPVVLVLPKAWVVTKSHGLPLSVKENLADAVSFEMDAITPFREDEALFDFRVAGESAGEITLSVAAVRKDTAQGYIDAVNEEGHEVRRLSFDRSAHESLLRLAGRPLPGREWGVDGEALGAKLGEVETSALVGGLKDVSEYSDAALGGAVEFLKESAGTGVAGVVGGVGGGGGGADLLSGGLRVERKRPVAFTLLLGAAAVAMLMFYLYIPVKAEDRSIQKMKAQVAALKPEVKGVEKLIAEISSMAGEISFIGQFKKEVMLSTVLKELTELLPMDAWLSRMRVDKRKVFFEGCTKGSARELLDRFEASEYFFNAEFSSPLYSCAGKKAVMVKIKMDIVDAVPRDENAAPVATEREAQGGEDVR